MATHPKLAKTGLQRQEGGSVKEKLLLAVFMIAFLAIGGEVLAQGNDFPGGFWAPSPSWGNIQPLTPVPGVGWANGQAAGPYYLTNRRGDRIQMEFVLDWWSLGPLQTVIRTTGDEEMKWLDDGSGAPGVWRGWCIQCGFDFIATTDNVVVWVEYNGSPQFGLHLQNFTVFPNANQPYDAIKQHQKAEAGRQAAENRGIVTALAVSGGPVGAAATLAGGPLAGFATGVLWTTMSVSLSREAGQLEALAKDPPCISYYDVPQWVAVDPNSYAASYCWNDFGDGGAVCYWNNLTLDSFVHSSAYWQQARDAADCSMAAANDGLWDWADWQAQIAQQAMANASAWKANRAYYIYYVADVFERWNIRSPYIWSGYENGAIDNVLRQWAGWTYDSAQRLP